jgi:hypothetical protein
LSVGDGAYRLVKEANMDARGALITRASEDREFREQLMADPRGTVAHEFGTTIAEDVEITVLEEMPKHVYIVLPVPPSELSAEQLEAVSGGAGWYFTCPC